MKKLNQQVLSSVFWKFLERILAQLISFIVSIVIARILTPKEYGLVALAMIFVNIANVFVANGFNTALIQNRNVDEIDFSTLFYCSFVISIIFYFLLFFLAPLIAVFYDVPELISLFRVMGLMLPLASYKSIQNAFVARHLDFKKFFYSTLIGTIVSAIVGIAMALTNFGVWALVAQYFTNNIIDALILTVTIDWKLQLKFSMARARPLLLYGSRILGADLIGCIYNQLVAFIVGKKYTSADLAFYTKGRQFPDLISNNIIVALTAVLFPAFSYRADDLDGIKTMASKTLQIIAYVLLPFYFGMIAVSDNLIIVLLGERWIPCVFFLNVMCVNGIVGVLDVIDIQVLKAIGRSDIVLKIEFIKKPIYFLIIILALRFNLAVLVLTIPVTSCLAILINSYSVSKYIHYTLFDKLKDTVASLLISSCMGGLVYSMKCISMGKIALLFLQIFFGVVVYVILSLITKNKSCYYLLKLLAKHNYSLK